MIFERVGNELTLYLIEVPLNAFENRAASDQAALTRAV